MSFNNLMGGLRQTPCEPCVRRAASATINGNCNVMEGERNACAQCVARGQRNQCHNVYGPTNKKYIAVANLLSSHEDLLPLVRLYRTAVRQSNEEAMKLAQAALTALLAVFDNEEAADMYDADMGDDDEFIPPSDEEEEDTGHDGDSDANADREETPLASDQKFIDDEDEDLD